VNKLIGFFLNELILKIILVRYKKENILLMISKELLPRLKEFYAAILSLSLLLLLLMIFHSSSSLIL